MFKFLVFLYNPNSYRLCVYQTLKTMCEYFRWLSTLSSLPINVFFYMYEMIHTLNENYWYKTYHSGFIGIFCNFVQLSLILPQFSKNTYEIAAILIFRLLSPHLYLPERTHDPIVTDKCSKAPQTI